MSEFRQRWQRRYDRAISEADPRGVTTTLFGCGSIGLRHLRNLRELGEKVLAYDTDPARMATAKDLGAEEADADAGRRSENVVIAAPAQTHAAFVAGLLESGRAIFVEKPLAMSAREASSIVALALSLSKMPYIRVGYQLRFDSQLLHLRAALSDIGVLRTARIEFGQFLGDWHPGENYLVGPYAKTGVLLESSHELDLICWLFGKTRSLGAFVRHDLGLGAEDTALSILEMESGMHISLHLDMTSPNYRRRIEVSGSRKTLTWNFEPERAADLYLAEMRSFLARDEAAGATIEDGLHALLLADSIKQAADSWMRRSGQLIINHQRAI